MASAGGIVVVILLILALGAAIAVFILLYTRTQSRLPCKTSANCFSYQTCDLPGTNSVSGACKSMPGVQCGDNNECSHYAPYCDPVGHYCTGDPSKPRGSAGNPPTIDGICSAGLILNQGAGICQYQVVGQPCVTDGACGQGLCINSTCQRSSTDCTGDTIMNPAQCASGLTCDPTSYQCTVPGVSPGSDGTPCQSTLDCVAGICAMNGPGSAPNTWLGGICRSGSLGFFENFVTSPPGTVQACIGPLLGGVGSSTVPGSTSWCRYDITSFMQCSTDDDCQYPYSTCSSQYGFCVAEPPVTDPIDPTQFTYNPIGVNATSSANIPVIGSFYHATAPHYEAATPLNITGGKLISHYTGFLPEGKQFVEYTGDRGVIISISAKTSFCVTSLAMNTTSQSCQDVVKYATQFPLTYTTILNEDPNALIAAIGLVPIVGDNVTPVFVFFRYGYSIPCYYQFAGNMRTGEQGFPSANSFLWNPSRVAYYTQAPRIKPEVNFITNPIVTPYVDGNVYLSPSAMLHGLIESKYTTAGSVPFYATAFHLVTPYGTEGSGNSFPNYGTSSGIVTFPVALDPATGTYSPLSPTNFLVTSWDAFSMGPVDPSVSGGYQYTTMVILYGLNTTTGNYEYYWIQNKFNLAIVGVWDMVIQLTNSVNNAYNVAAIRQIIAFDKATPKTHIRITRLFQFQGEPQLVAVLFYMTINGLAVAMYAFDNTNPALNFDVANVCSAVSFFEGIKDIKYVTSVTGGRNYGGFVLWGSTSSCSDMFAVFSASPYCQNTIVPYTFTEGIAQTAVYWRRLNSEAASQNYWLYPVGGSSMPTFLATDKPLTFDGIPVLYG